MIVLRLDLFHSVHRRVRTPSSLSLPVVRLEGILHELLELTLLLYLP